MSTPPEPNVESAPFPLPRYRTGRPDLDQRLVALIDAIGVTENRDLLFEILASAVRLAGDGADRLDLKITSAALREMRDAYRMFAPYDHVPKVTIFGSARTLPDAPVYAQARDLAAAIAACGWMVVTGAGPGIMQAGMEGAGRERSLGVRIRLPFETGANPLIAGDDKLVTMKYFFTRKLMLMKESAGFVALPGGFGTLDETLELLTLQQTGKAEPAPLVLLDTPGDSFWADWSAFARDTVAARGLINPDDLDLYQVTDDVAAARDTIIGFYRNYHSLRWVGPRLVLRLNALPTDEEVGELNDRFSHLCVKGPIERRGPLAAEVADEDQLDRPRLVMTYDPFHPAALHQIIAALNALPSAPAAAR